MLVSALQQSESVIHTHMFPYLFPLASPSLPPSLSHPSRWSQSTEQQNIFKYRECRVKQCRVKHTQIWVEREKRMTKHCTSYADTLYSADLSTNLGQCTVYWLPWLFIFYIASNAISNQMSWNKLKTSPFSCKYNFTSYKTFQWWGVHEAN